MSEALHWTTVGVMVFVLALQLVPAWARIRRAIPDPPAPTHEEMENLDTEPFQRIAQSWTMGVFRERWRIEKIENAETVEDSGWGHRRIVGNLNEYSAFVKFMDRTLLPHNLGMSCTLVRIVSITLLAMLAIARFAVGEPILNLFAR